MSGRHRVGAGDNHFGPYTLPCGPFVYTTDKGFSVGCQTHHSSLAAIHNSRGLPEILFLRGGSLLVLATAIPFLALTA